MPAGRALPVTLAATMGVPAMPRRRPEPAPAGTVALRNVYLHVTKACNLHCAYCYFTASKPLPGEMSAADLAPLWPQLAALRPSKVVFTGGEPLLRPDLVDMLRGLRAADPEHHVLRCLNTNGHLVTSNFVYQPGGPGDIVVVQLFYQWPIYVSLMNLGNLSNMSNHSRLLVATAAFRNEPYN